MAKMLDFLRRYQHGMWSRPRTIEAAKLEALIVSHSGSLTVPDLEKGIASDTLDPAIRKFLMSNMGGYLRQRRDSTATSSMASMDMNVVLSAAEAARQSVMMEEGAPSDDQQDSNRLTNLPEPLKDQICFDFFLDVVTQKSFFLQRTDPVCVVVEHSLQTLGLLNSPAARARMLRFTERVEQGYPDTNCELAAHLCPTAAHSIVQSCNDALLCSVA